MSGHPATRVVKLTSSLRLAVLDGGALALELRYLPSGSLAPFDRLEHLDDVLGLLRFLAAHEEVLQALGLGSGSHADTVVAATSRYKWSLN